MLLTYDCRALNEEAYSVYIPQIQQNNPLDHAEDTDLFGTVIPAGLSYDDTILYEIMPEYHGNGADITLTITGAGFDPQMAVALVDDNEVSYLADDVEYISNGKVEATFSAHSIPAGMYSLQTSQELSQDSLLNAFEVLKGGNSDLVTSLELPDVLGYSGLKTIYVKYENDGEITMSAPLLHLTATQNNRQAALLTLESNLATQGLSTSTMPQGFSHSIQILAQGCSPGRLYPGESVRIPVYWAGWLKPWNYSYPPVSIGLGILTTEENTPINHNQIEQAIQPADMDASTWAAIWRNFTAQTGNTWGDYVRMLDDNATYLAKINRNVTDISKLLAFEFAQANGLGILSSLGGSTDAAVTAPGLDIVFRRAFLPSITGRYGTGPFGRGWYHNWGLSLATDQDNAVIIEGPFGSQRVFQPDGDNGYSSQPGDQGRLVYTFQNTYELIESNGMRSVFSGQGLLSSITDTNGNRITASYTNGLLSRLTHSSGQWLQLAYNSNGRITSITDSTGLQTIYGYDTGYEHLTAVEWPDGYSVGYSYNTGSSLALEHSLASIENPGSIYQYFTYDTQGRLSTVSKSGNTETLSLSYDSAGMIAVADAQSSTAEYYLDQRGLVAKTVNPLGQATYFGHDNAYNLTELTDMTGNSHTYSYDQQGNLVQWIDALGNISQFQYGTNYSRMTRLTDAKHNETQYEYDEKGNLKSIIYADGTAENYTYDTLGNAITATSRRGSQISYQYNTAGQTTSKSTPLQGLVTYSYDTEGNLTSYTDSTGTTELVYNLKNQLERITYPGDRYLEYSYDTAGRRATCTDQLGHILTYAYDAVGHLESITDAGEGEIVSYQYDDTGRLSTKTLGNGVYTKYAYDAMGQILSLINYDPDDVVLSQFDYEYDSLGRRVAMTTLYGTWQYTYDDLGQLTAWADPDGHHVEYIYDPLGNRVTEISDGVPYDYTTNGMNQYTQADDITYTYGADGNMQSKTDSTGTTTYEYDPENRLIRVEVPAGDVWDYIYDGLGNRVAVIENGIETQYVHDPIGLVDVVGEYAGNGSMASRYVHGYGLASRIADTGDAEYYSFDALGSTSEVTDDLGQILNSYAYTPFGESILSFETVSNAFQFVGEYGVMHEGSGLDFMRTRYYDSDIGRFLSEDFIGLRGGDINLRNYVWNNPMMLIDPSGTLGAEPSFGGTKNGNSGISFGMPDLDRGIWHQFGGDQDPDPDFFGSGFKRGLEDVAEGHDRAAQPRMNADYQPRVIQPSEPDKQPNANPKGQPHGDPSPLPEPSRTIHLPIPPDIGDSGSDPTPVPSREADPDPDPDPEITFTLTVKSEGGYGVSISSSTVHGGTTDYSLDVPSGKTVILTAPKYLDIWTPFLSWTGTVNSTNEIITFKMDSDKTVTANYLENDEL